MNQHLDKQEADSVLLTDRDDAHPAHSLSAYLKFIIPSLIGVLFFLTPVVVDGKVTIGMGVLADELKALTKDYLPAFATGLLAISALVALYAALLKPRWASKDSTLVEVFTPKGGWLALRVVGAAFAAMTLFEVGPEWVWNRNTGGVMLMDLTPVLITFFFFAAILLPFLVDFGFMEFIGTLLRNIFQKVFKLPGRSSIDAVASWLGSGTVGVLITTQQYEQGFYSKREAAVIATNFSIASIAFSLLISNFIGLDHLFVPFYLTVVAAGLVAAVITPRLPPLSWKKDEYNSASGKQIKEAVPNGHSLFSWGLEQAVRRAHNAPGAAALGRSCLMNVTDIWFGLLPLVMAIGTVSLALTEYTPIFTWLSYPFIPLLELLQLPEAAAAAPAMLVGFADMFLPAVLGKGIESELTRFVVACVSLTQLIYMSEVGVLLLKSKIPLNLLELFAIFILRTLITLPIIALIAHTLVF
ncbi:YjiH family protein [Marinobacterium arenosum]|uniref:YjiH family protein n=1 Tax=Marinobacterium arenosum TaxID=2862496 RepID=UPI001C98D1B4|nr:YjiH family protein [Marinobacterium arenosum]MBY4677508.1 YjiH family protein [Marinobacterium arenosum]